MSVLDSENEVCLQPGTFVCTTVPFNGKDSPLYYIGVIEEYEVKSSEYEILFSCGHSSCRHITELSIISQEEYDQRVAYGKALLSLK